MRKKGPNKVLIWPVRLTGSSVHAASSDANTPVMTESLAQEAEEAWGAAGGVR